MSAALLEVQNLSIVQANADDPTWPASDLVIKIVSGENVVPIKMTSSDPQEATVFLNSLLEAYRDELRRERRSQLQRLNAVAQLDDQELDLVSHRGDKAVDQRHFQAAAIDKRRPGDDQLVVLGTGRQPTDFNL